VGKVVRVFFFLGIFTRGSRALGKFWPGFGGRGKWFVNGGAGICLFFSHVEKKKPRGGPEKGFLRVVCYPSWGGNGSDFFAGAATPGNPGKKVGGGGGDRGGGGGQSFWGPHEIFRLRKTMCFFFYGAGAGGRNKRFFFPRFRGLYCQVGLAFGNDIFFFLLAVWDFSFVGNPPPGDWFGFKRWGGGGRLAGPFSKKTKTRGGGGG